MNNERFLELWNKTLEQDSDCMTTKGADYAGSEDRLANFKRNAERWGMTPIQVWSIYFGKHMDAIESYVKKGKLESEPIEARIMDARNYLFLLKCLIEDVKK